MHRRRVWGTPNREIIEGTGGFETAGLVPQPNARLTHNTVHCTLNRRRITNLRFADDVLLLARTGNQLEKCYQTYVWKQENMAYSCTRTKQKY
eukprot:12416925-Karenia_brevis.AAC.1